MISELLGFLMLAPTPSGQLPDPSVVPKRNFACDIATTNNLPKVILIGETHNNPQSIETRTALFEGAKAGYFALGSEVSNGLTDYFGFAAQSKSEVTKGLGGDSEIPIHGIESEIPYSIVVSYATTLEAMDDLPQDDAVFRLAIFASELALSNYAFSELTKDQSQPKQVRKLATDVSTYINKPEFKKLSMKEDWLAW